MTHNELSLEQYEDLLHNAMIAFFNSVKGGDPERVKRFLMQVKSMEIDDALKKQIIGVINDFLSKKDGKNLFMKIKDVVNKYQAEAEKEKIKAMSKNNSMTF